VDIEPVVAGVVILGLEVDSPAPPGAIPELFERFFVPCRDPEPRFRKPFERDGITSLMAGFGKHGVKHRLEVSRDLEDLLDVLAPKIPAVDMHVKTAGAVHEITPPLKDPREFPDLMESFVSLEDGAYVLPPVVS